jgi:hypothetical protein
VFAYLQGAFVGAFVRIGGFALATLFPVVVDTGVSIVERDTVMMALVYKNVR